MTTLDEARELMAGARRVVGFAPPAPASPAAVAKVERIADAAVKAALADFGRRIAAEPPRSTWTGPGTGDGDTLRKRAASEDEAIRAARERERGEVAEAAALGKLAGERLVAAADALRKRHAAAVARRIGATGIVGAYEERDRIKALAKTTPGYVSGAMVADSTQRPEFLAALGAVQAQRDIPGDVKASLAEMNTRRGELTNRLIAACDTGDPAVIESVRREIQAWEMRMAMRMAPRLPSGAAPRAGAVS